MSYEAVQWAMDRAPMLRTDKGKPDTTSRHVLAALAEHASPDGTDAYPSVPLLQYKTGYSRRAIQEALCRLEAGGLVFAKGKRLGCTNWSLAVWLKRPESDRAELDAETEQRREATAERVRRHRAKAVTPSDGVTVTRSDGVTGGDVTPSDGVSNAVEQRYVTPSAAPKPSFEPPRTSLSSDAPPPDAPEPPAPASEREIRAARNDKRLTAAQEAIRATAAVPEDDEPAFIAWATAEHNVRSPGWWRTTARDLPEIAARWRAGLTSLQQRASPTNLPPWCGECDSSNPAAEFNAKFRFTAGEPCPACHPDKIKDVAA